MFASSHEEYFEVIAPTAVLPVTDKSHPASATATVLPITDNMYAGLGQQQRQQCRQPAARTAAVPPTVAAAQNTEFTRP